MLIRTTADNRKDVVNAISAFTGIKPVYMGPPSFAYQIGDITIKRDGNAETVENETGEKVKKMLIEKEMAESDEDLVEIKIPINDHTGLSLKNLVFMIHSKQYLINHALQRNVFQVNEKLIAALTEKELATREEFISLFQETGGNDENLGFYFTDENIVFDRFPFDEDGEKIKVYTELTARMCLKALKQKRIRPKETKEENEKYYMRVWLVRLGFGGPEGKTVRKVLLQKLNGHTAFRTEEEIVKAREKAKLKRQKLS